MLRPLVSHPNNTETSASRVASRHISSAEASPSSADLERLFEHMATTLNKIDFIKQSPAKILMQKIRRIYVKAQLTREELQILRGILTAIDSYDKTGGGRNSNGRPHVGESVEGES